MSKTNDEAIREKELEAIESFEGWLNELDETAPEPIVPEGLVDAGTLLYEIKAMKLSQARLETERTETIAKRTKEINNFYGPKAKKLQERIDHVKKILEAYVTQALADNPKFKCATPYGTAYFSAGRAKWDWDEEKTLEYLKQSEKTSLIEVKESFDKREVKKTFKVVSDDLGTILVDEDGMIFDGATISVGEKIFIIKER